MSLEDPAARLLEAVAKLETSLPDPDVLDRPYWRAHLHDVVRGVERLETARARLEVTRCLSEALDDAMQDATQDAARFQENERAVLREMGVLTPATGPEPCLFVETSSGDQYPGFSQPGVTTRARTARLAQDDRDPPTQANERRLRNPASARLLGPASLPRTARNSAISSGMRSAPEFAGPPLEHWMKPGSALNSQAVQLMYAETQSQVLTKFVIGFGGPESIIKLKQTCSMVRTGAIATRLPEPDLNLSSLSHALDSVDARTDLYGYLNRIYLADLFEKFSHELRKVVLVPPNQPPKSKRSYELDKLVQSIYPDVSSPEEMKSKRNILSSRKNHGRRWSTLRVEFGRGVLLLCGNEGVETVHRMTEVDFNLVLRMLRQHREDLKRMAVCIDRHLELLMTGLTPPKRKFEDMAEEEILALKINTAEILDCLGEEPD